MAALRGLVMLLATAGLFSFGAAVFAAPIKFTSAFDDSPLELKPLPNEQITKAVKSFTETGINPYKNDANALAEGKKLYLENCQACHMPDGSGHIGPSLIGETHHYPRFATDQGIFEIVYGGASGAMQPFGRLLTQDQVLRVTAFVRTLKKQPAAQ
jgi:cytochrome c-L